MAAVHVSRMRWCPSPSDVAIAATVAGAGQLVVWGRWGTEPFYGSRPYNAVVSLLTLGALAWWRRAPVAAVIWFVTLFCAVQVVRPHDLPAWTGYFPLVVLVTAAGRTARVRPAAVALVVALAGFALLGVLEPTLHSADTAVFDALVLVLPWAAARVLAVRSERAEALEADLTSLAEAHEGHEREVVARERAQMARELHDVVAHSVSLMVVQVGAARMALSDGSQASAATARDQLLGAEQTGRSALDQLRRMLGVLRDPDPAPVPGSAEPFASVPTEPLPVLADVLRLVEDFRAKGMNVDTVTEVALEDVDGGVGLTAYRIVQEALTNALKHAPGADVTVRVTGDADRVALEVTDRGGRPRVGPGTGFGLLGLRERVALYGGRLHAGPTDLGWRLEVELPRRPAGRSADRLPATSALVEEVAE